MTNPTNTHEDELIGDIFARACKNNEYFGKDGWYELHTPTVRSEIKSLIATQREQEFWKGVQHVDEAREQARQELLDELAAKADAEYSRSGIDNWLFALGNHVHDAILQSKRATLKGDKK